MGSRSNFAVLNIPAADAAVMDHQSPVSDSYRRVVHMASLSPSGMFSAAIVDVVCHDMRSVTSLPPSELHVWTCEKPFNPEEEEEDDIDESPGQVWRHIGIVALHRHAVGPVEANGHEFAASAGASLDWAHDDSLALLVPVPIPSSQPRDPLNDSSDMFEASSQQGGALLSITKWRTDEFEDGPSFGDTWNGKVPGKIPNIDMPGVPLVLPFTSGPDGMLMLKEWYGEGDCACVVWGKGKIAVYSVTAPSSEGGGVSPIPPLYISDAGRSGPYLSVQVSQYSHLHSSHADAHISGGHHAHCHHSSNAMATHSGHSFRESCIRPNKASNVDAPLAAIKSQVPKQKRNTFEYESAGISSNCNERDMEGLFSCGCRTDMTYHTFPLLVALDSLGSIICVRLSTYPELPMKCTAKVSSSHVSGVS